MTSPIWVALDTTDLSRAQTLAAACAPHVAGMKLGLEFFLSHGRAGVQSVAQSTGATLPIFLDLKLHDIPNTVGKAIDGLAGLPIHMLTIHAAGGAAMIRAAADASHRIAAHNSGVRPQVIAVTVLTSLDAADVVSIGVNNTPVEQAVRLALLAKASGADGVVCSPHEIAAIKAACGNEFVLVVPGIRPVGTALGDQKRAMTPKEALALGATHLVIGRPITDAENPATAAKQMLR